MNRKNIMIHSVVVRGVTYLRAEDVAKYIEECGIGEETDVRNRLKKASEIIVNQTKI